MIVPAVSTATVASAHDNHWLSESSAAALARIIACFLGFSGMAAFLLTSGRGLVNVFVFLLLFVVVQVILCVIATVVMARTLRGRQSVVLPINPARFIVSRLFPDKRYFREVQSVVRLLFLRYGQELGAVFTLGAVVSFFLVLGLSDFTFVWGSTFRLSDSLVGGITDVLALPWSSLAPAATVDAQVIADSRFHPAITDLGMADLESMRGWWPFLIMAMISYGLVPRLLLWLVSKYFYVRQIREALISLPGSELVLARMKSPLVRTQGEAHGPQTLASAGSGVVTNDRLLLVNWSNALAPADAGQFEPLFAVGDGNIVNAGLGSLSQELEGIKAKLAQPIDHLYIAVKSWEPPMADLADFLSHCAAIHRCTLYLVPLAGRPIAEDKLEDWRGFSRALAFEVIEVLALKRIDVP